MKTVSGRLWKLRAESRPMCFSPALLVHEYINSLRDEGRTIYHMAFGESPFPLHPLLEESLIKHLNRQGSPGTFYQCELHTLALRYFGTKLGINESDYRALGAGNSAEIVSRIHHVLAGDLLIPVPGRLSGFQYSGMTQEHMITIALNPENGYRLTPWQLRDSVQSARERGQNPAKLYLNYPGDPCGQDYSSLELSELADTARSLHIMIISDESNGIALSGHGHQSIANYYPEGTVVISGLPGQLALGGFSFVIALLPVQFEYLYQLMRNTMNYNLNPFTTAIQYGFMTTFMGNNELEEYMSICSRIQYVINSYVSRTLEAVGLYCPTSALAFYLYIDFEAFRKPIKQKYRVFGSGELTESLLLERQVATLPGTVFGDDPQNLRLRISPTDFNGKAALDYYEKFGLAGVDNFIDTCCSRVEEGVRRILQYLS